MDVWKPAKEQIQERRALREQALLAEQRYFYLVQNIPLLIFELTRDFQLDFINQACSTLLGYSPEEAINVPYWLLDRIHQKDRQRVRDLFRAAFESRIGPFSVECRFIHREGHLINVILKSIPPSQCIPGNSADRLEGIVIDITDRVFLEKVLIQKEKLKTLDTISAEVAHEIRNPLVSIGGFARRLQKQMPDSAEMNIILRESMRLEKLLERILNYLKPAKIQHQECSVNKIINKCLKMLSSEIEKQDIDYQLNLTQGTSMVYADQDKLVQVFINLMRNAIKALEKKKTLFIRTFESDQNVYIDFMNQVRYSHSRIKNPELLCLPFDEAGQNIGLPMCYRLLKKMDGLLSCTQENDNIVFTVSLPRHNLPVQLGSLN